MTTPAERFAAANVRGKHPLTIEFIEQFDFGFDEFQIIACQAVEDGKGVLVAAPTGAGKTVVGEFAADQPGAHDQYLPLRRAWRLGDG